MSKYIIGVDTWEGNPLIDEGVLFAAGVQFMIVRLNDMNGGHHMDTGFTAQWEQARPFVRWPYFVYNPWVSGLQNFDWLAAHMPSDAGAVSVDIEVKYPGYSPSSYAAEVDGFINLAKREWLVNIYTGAWFASYLSRWPKEIPYWWARYPYAVYPGVTTKISWADLAVKLEALPWSPGTTPGPCNLWQVTADRYILPGCGETRIDVNIWRGTLDELKAFAGLLPQPPAKSWQEALTDWARSKGYDGPNPPTS